MSDESISNQFMQEALQLARHAESVGEVPVGAVVVCDGEIIGRGYNQPIKSNDSTAHAEIVAIREACQQQKNYRLSDCDIYVTLEPCSMCAGAIVHARLNRIIYAASDPKTGACGSIVDLVSSNPNGHRVEVIAGINLPMLIKLAGLRDSESLEDAVSAAQESGRKYINVASKLLTGKE